MEIIKRLTKSEDAPTLGLAMVQVKILTGRHGGKIGWMVANSVKERRDQK